jgi:serine/threonine-protein kinase
VGGRASEEAPQVRFRLAWRFFFATALVLAVTGAWSMWWTARSADQAAAVAATRGLGALRDEVAAYLAGDQRALEEGAAVFARASAFRSLVATGRAADALDQSREAAELLRAAWVQVTDADGVRLAKSDDPNAPPERLTTSPLVRDALAGRTVSAFGTLDDTSLVHVVALPVEGATAGGIVGTMVVARPLDARAARGGAADGEVAFVIFPREGRVRLSGATLRVTPALTAAVGALRWPRAAADSGGELTGSARAGAARPDELTLDGTRYLALAEPLRAATGRAVGGYAVLRGRDAELAAFATLRRTMLVAGGVGLLVALLVSFAVARQVTRPLATLAEAARRASAGEFGTPIRVRSRDEVGVLAAAFQALLDDLREKQVLVEFARLTPVRPAGRRWQSSPVTPQTAVSDDGSPPADFATAPFRRRMAGGAGAPAAERLPADELPAAEPVSLAAAEGGEGVAERAPLTTPPAVTPRPPAVRHPLVGALASIRGAADALRPGQLFARRYRIEAMIGAGGVGVVFRAHDTERQERVALKVLRPDVALDDPKALARLAREADTARVLAHPNVVRTFDLGTSDGLHFLTMEYVEGPTLRALVDKHRPLPVDTAVACARQLCRALAHAHEHGIVHRDVKPHNAVVTAAGVLRVMDFGLARVVDLPGGITETGILLGTPAYMAPEVLRGATSDPRSDVYAVGAVLFECLVGEPPFGSGAGSLVVLTQVLEGPAPDPCALRPDVPRWVGDVVLAALAKDPAARPQSAAEMADQLTGAAGAAVGSGV